MREQHNPRAEADARMVANKTALTGALAKVGALVGYEFDRAAAMGYKPSIAEVGLIADDVLAQLPAAVTYEGPNRIKHYSQTAVLALLVEAVKELQATEGGGGEGGGDVYLAGNNTFTGQNTFAMSVAVGAPVATQHAATKGYVDTAIAGGAQQAQSQIAALEAQVVALQAQVNALLTPPL